jgi:predicted transcriptional regulator
MRTTLQLDDALVSEAKVLAARTGRTLSQVIEDALFATDRIDRKTYIAHRRASRDCATQLLA